MEWFSKGNYLRGILLSAILFASLFITHIVLAANGYSTLFKIVALKIGLIIAIPLNISLGWAYAGMTISIAWMVAFPVLTTVLHLIASRRTEAL